MAQTNVSSCILSIVASFTSGLDIFKRFRETQGKIQRKSRKNAAVGEEELRLASSLRKGPEDINREYQRNVCALGEHGEQFALGDGIAQTALAEVLLKLNTGLVNIINQFLRRDKRASNLDYGSLTNLSDRSRIDTCRTLRQLYRRMMQLRPAPSLKTDEERRAPEHKSRSKLSLIENKHYRPVANPKHAKVRRPMLAQIVIADSSKSQVAMVRPGKKSKSSSSSALAKAQSSTSLELRSSTAKTLTEPRSRPFHSRSQTLPELPKPRREHSTPDVITQAQLSNRPKPLVASHSTPRLPMMPALDREEPLLPVPTTSPLPAAPLESRRRKPTPTYYSIESNSTKLGEIPMHKWAVPYDFDAQSRLNREAERDGWPINHLRNAQEANNKKTRLGIFRLFRKSKQQEG